MDCSPYINTPRHLVKGEKSDLWMMYALYCAGNHQA